MIVLAGGIFIIAAALFYFAFKLRIAYSIGRSPESAGGVPTLDGVFLPPAFCAWGIWFVASEIDELRVSAWVAAGFWPLLTVAAAVAMIAATAAGRRNRRRK